MIYEKMFCLIFLVYLNLSYIHTAYPPLFSTKTPYSYIANDQVNITKPGLECTMRQINMVHRHGHRFPSDGDMEEFEELAKKINKATLTILPSVNLSLPWTPPYHMVDESRLTRVGEKELYDIGKRIKLRFPSLWNNEYTSTLFKFMSTNKLRTTHSASSLAAGLFDGIGSIDKRIQPIALETTPKDPNDKLLRFYKACDNYKSEIDDNEKVLVENKKFGKGLEIKNIINKVLKKLGKKSLGITYTNLLEIYVACAYEIGMFEGSFNSGLCALLDESDRRALEYASDLEKFYQHDDLNNLLTYKISCPLLEDIFESLTKGVKNKSEYIGIFRSTHSTAMLMFYSLLGLNKQKIPLRHNNFADQKNRPFKSSTIAPFSANAYFVLYECSGKMKIQLYWNERLQKIPCCESKADCDFEAFQKCYGEIAKKCSKTFDDLCTKTSPSVETMKQDLNVWF